MTTVAVAGSTYTFNIALYQQADPLLLQTPPTLAAADFTRSINGGALGALTNTPTVTPAGGCQVQIVLSAAETTAAGEGGLIAVYWQDAVGAEWCSGGALVPVYAGQPTTDAAWTIARAAFLDAAISSRMAAGALVALTAAYDAAMTAAQAGDAMALTVGERGSVADAVWTRTPRTLTQPAVAPPVSAGLNIVLYRNANNTVTVTGLALDPLRVETYFTVKRAYSDTDAQAVLQISETAGLLTLNGAPAANPAWGSLVVGPGLDTATIFLQDAAMAQVVPLNCGLWDIKELRIGGAEVPQVYGTCAIRCVVTLEIA